MLFFSEVKANRLKIRALSVDGPPISLEKSLFSPKVFTLIVQSVNALRRVGEEVKAKNEKLLRRRCARMRVCEWESVFTRRKAEGTPERDRGPRPRAKKSGSNETTPAVPKWERRGLFGRGCRQAAMGEGISRRGEVTPVPRCGRCIVREAGDIGGILRNPFRAPPSSGGGRWATGSR